MCRHVDLERLVRSIQLVVGKPIGVYERPDIEAEVVRGLVLPRLTGRDVAEVPGCELIRLRPRRVNQLVRGEIHDRHPLVAVRILGVVQDGAVVRPELYVALRDVVAAVHSVLWSKHGSSSGGGADPIDGTS